MPRDGLDRESPHNTWTRLRDHLVEAREAYEEEADVYENPDCPHCDREMEKGAIGGGEVTYGCYRDDCPYKEDNITSYVIKRSTLPAKKASQRYQTVLDIIQGLAREEHDRPHDPTTCLGCSTDLESAFEESYGVCEDCSGVLGL